MTLPEIPTPDAGLVTSTAENIPGLVAYGGLFVIVVLATLLAASWWRDGRKDKTTQEARDRNAAQVAEGMSGLADGLNAMTDAHRDGMAAVAIELARIRDRIGLEDSPKGGGAQ